MPKGIKGFQKGHKDYLSKKCRLELYKRYAGEQLIEFLNK